MRIATSLLLVAGAGALAVGVWLLSSSPVVGGPAEVSSSRELLTVDEVDFPEPLTLVADARPPRRTRPPEPPRETLDPPAAKPRSATTWLDAPPAPWVATFEEGRLPEWLEQRVATGRGSGFAAGVGDRVGLSFERLRLMSMLEGRGGAVVTRPLTPVRGHCLVVRKRTRIHPGRQLSAAETTVLSADEGERLGAVMYVRAPSIEGFLVGDEHEHVRRAATWDAWFDEVVTWDPLTGALFLSVDGEPPVVHEQRPASGPVRVGLAASGLGMGHVHEVDRLEIRWSPCQLGEGDGT